MTNKKPLNSEQEDRVYSYLENFITTLDGKEDALSEQLDIYVEYYEECSQALDLMKLSPFMQDCHALQTGILEALDTLTTFESDVRNFRRVMKVSTRIAEDLGESFEDGVGGIEEKIDLLRDYSTKVSEQLTSFKELESTLLENIYFEHIGEKSIYANNGYVLTSPCKDNGSYRLFRIDASSASDEMTQPGILLHDTAEGYASVALAKKRIIHPGFTGAFVLAKGNEDLFLGPTTVPLVQKKYELALFTSIQSVEVN